MQNTKDKAFKKPLTRLLTSGCAILASLCLVTGSQPPQSGAIFDTGVGIEENLHTPSPRSFDTQYGAAALGINEEDKSAQQDLEDLSRIKRLTYNLPGVSNKSVWAHPNLTTLVNGKALSEPALVINDHTYVPLRSFANALGIGVSYDSSSRTMTLSGSGLYLTATDGGFVTYVNSRPFFSFSPNVIMSNGRMYIPGSALAKALGLKVDYVSSTVASYSGSYNPAKPASQYYRDDEVLWLARIINAEAGGESLLGQIAVGDVILNRVKSAQFPNTIYGVIFDRRYGIQFSPVANGTVYNTPTYTATLAARICLEGTSLTDTAMYFLNPRLSTSVWISNNRPYVYSIGGHDFYS